MLDKCKQGAVQTEFTGIILGTGYPRSISLDMNSNQRSVDHAPNVLDCEIQIHQFSEYCDTAYIFIRDVVGPVKYSRVKTKLVI